MINETKLANSSVEKKIFP